MWQEFRVVCVCVGLLECTLFTPDKVFWRPCVFGVLRGKGETSVCLPCLFVFVFLWGGGQGGVVDVFSVFVFGLEVT